MIVRCFISVLTPVRLLLGIGIIFSPVLSISADPGLQPDQVSLITDLDTTTATMLGEFSSTGLVAPLRPESSGNVFPWDDEPGAKASAMVMGLERFIRVRFGKPTTATVQIGLVTTVIFGKGVDFDVPGTSLADPRPSHITITNSEGEQLFEWRGAFRFLQEQEIGSRIADFDYRGKLLREPESEFEEFWQKAREELVSIDPRVSVQPQPDKNTTTAEAYRVEFDSVDQARIVAWLLVPKEALASRPAVAIFPGYGAEEPASDRSSQGLVTLAVSPRGHGPSLQTGTWKSDGPLLLHGIKTPDQYFYRQAILDAAQAVRVLDQWTTIGKIATEGGSQGGLLALGAAVVFPDKIHAVIANVPCFSDYGLSLPSALAGPHQQLSEALEKASPDERRLLETSLAMTDGVALASRIQQPIQVVMGFLDPVSPVASGFAIANRSPSKNKSLIILGNWGHALPPPMQSANQDWLQQHLAP